MLITFGFLHETEQIFNVLKEFGDCFPGLNERVESIEGYAKKLSESARVISMKEDNECVGLCCYYANDNETFVGYISLIGIKTPHQGNGKGKALLDFVCEDCNKVGMKKIRLEVDSDNNKALSFYKKNGFRFVKKARENSYYMELVL